MFAGPNGSGKSVLKSYLPPELLGFYLNPDEIEDRLLSGGFLEFGSFGIEATAEEALQFLAGSPFLASADWRRKSRSWPLPMAASNLVRWRPTLILLP